MKLPALLIDANLQEALRIPSYVAESTSRRVVLDASSVVAIQPVSACLLGSADLLARESGKQLVVDQWSRPLRLLLERMDCRVNWGEQRAEVRGVNSQAQAPTLATLAATRSDGNLAANRLASRLASFIPSEDRNALLSDECGLRQYQGVEPALAYILSELTDNVFSHAASRERPRPAAWLAAQWYPTGDLVRVAVVDNGCGLLASLRNYWPPPKNHFEAVPLAFRPFVSSKSGGGLYADRTHMGLGLAVCREICTRLDGTFYAASGNAFVVNPGLPQRDSKRLMIPHRGTIISMEFHRRNASSRTLQEALAVYTGGKNLRARFEL